MESLNESTSNEVEFSKPKKVVIGSKRQEVLHAFTALASMGLFGGGNTPDFFGSRFSLTKFLNDVDVRIKKAIIAPEYLEQLKKKRSKKGYKMLLQQDKQNLGKFASEFLLDPKTLIVIPELKVLEYEEAEIFLNKKYPEIAEQLLYIFYIGTGTDSQEHHELYGKHIALY
jgi:hypothetical protein